MGKLKNNEAKTFELTEREFNYLKLLATCLTYNIGKDKLVSGFMSYVAHNRLGFKEGVDLQFEIDLDSENYEILIKKMPAHQ